MKLKKTKLEPWQRAAKKSYIIRYSDGNLTFDDYFTLSQMNCHYCNSPPSNKLKGEIYGKIVLNQEEENNRYFIYNGLDRINPLKNHNKENVITCCFKCNRAKSNYSYYEFINWISRIRQHLFVNNNILKLKELSK